MGWIDEVALGVAIMMANPGHCVGQAVFIAAVGHHVEDIVNAEQDIEPARVTRIGVEEVAGGVLVEDASRSSSPTLRF